MATNREIIAMEMVLNNITEEVHTYAKWKSLGFQVKKGEKAVINTRLWKKVDVKKKAAAEEKTEENAENTEEKTVKGKRFHMVKSALFGRSQVEPIEKKVS